MAVQRAPITRAGLEQLHKELEHLRHVERPAILIAVKEARAHGDLSENAEYDAAREKQAQIESRIGYLENKISISEIISVDTANSDTVLFGCTVKIIDLDDDEEEEYTLVGADEADPAQGKISTISPIGKALIGHKKGEVVTVDAPGGLLKFKIVDFY